MDQNVWKRILPVLLAVFLLGCGSLTAALAGTPAAPDVFGAESHRLYRGVDVSVWQGKIDFEEVKRSGIDAVYIRAGEGSNFIDSRFEENYEAARSAGLKYGFYHYVTARSASEARQQADFFARLIRNKPQDLRAAMDFENLSGLTAAEAVNIAKAYLKQLERQTGHKPAVYSDASDAESVWRSNLTDYPLWVADYGVREPYSIGGWETWSGFQYSSRGEVAGIHGHVDLDRFREEIFLTDKEQKQARKARHQYNRTHDGCSCCEDAANSSKETANVKK